MDYDRNTINKVIKRCALDFDVNPAFIGFRLLSAQACTAAIKKLRNYGYDCIYVTGENSIIIYKN